MHNRLTYKEPLVFILLVNWNNYHDTVECLNTLLKIRHKNKRILILDNASTDDSLQKTRKWIDDRSENNDKLLTIHSLNENLGFGGANNIGMKFALKNGADYVLLLNNDTVVTEDFLSNMIKTALSTETTGIIGGKIKYFNDNDRIWFSGGYIDFFRGAFYHREDDCSGLRKSDFITGCLMLIPTYVIRKVGYFDERYFLNVEDIDFSCRVRDAGYALIVNCDVIIHHKVSSSIGGLFSLKHQYYFHRNRMLFFSKRIKGIRKILFFSFQFSIAIPVWIVIQLFKQRGQSIKGAIWGYFDYMKGHFGKSKFF